MDRTTYQNQMSFEMFFFLSIILKFNALINEKLTSNT